MDAPLFDTHTFHFTRSTAAALKHSQLPERYHGGILNERTPSLIKKGNISWNKPPFVQIEEQVGSRRAVASKAEGGEGEHKREETPGGHAQVYAKRKAECRALPKDWRRRLVSLGPAEMFLITCVYLRRPFRGGHVVCITYISSRKLTKKGLQWPGNFQSQKFSMNRNGNERQWAWENGSKQRAIESFDPSLDIV